MNALRESDAKEKYNFWFKTNQDRYAGAAVTLIITALQVKIRPTTVTEGQSVTLTCTSTCSLSSPSYIWYKNSLPVSTKLTPGNNTLFFRAVHIADAGRYVCAVEGHEDHLSSAVTLSVRYAPRNTSISVTPPGGDILEGSSVTLTCGSDANPLVHNFTWYRKTGDETLQIGSGQNYSFARIHSKCSGHYYCLAKNDVGSDQSLSLLVDVKYAPRNITALPSPSVTIMEGASVTLTCNSDANPPVHNYTWYKKYRSTESSLIVSGQKYSISHARPVHRGRYYCKAENKVGATASTTLHVHVHKPPLWGSIGALLAPILILMAGTVAVCLSVCWRNTETIAAEDDSMTHSEKEDSGPIYCNISAMPTAPGNASGADAGDGDDVQYATVRFTHSTTQDGTPQGCASEDDVEYATVNFSVLTTTDAR
ncbi:B-cell receptor CD22-like [Clupea harengus]|uniref:B-cell receptor CD22-like n=1 Tax=Clupea harengus TaxID=7950 RepID=A0A6P8F3E6_CLUHA|nr:B-cell receptor CD22-like [Clupea harengus]